MSRPRPPEPVTLVVGVLHREEFDLEPVCRALTMANGPIARVSDPLPFTETDYYAPEMGAPLVRRMIAHQMLIDPEDLADVKWRTNAIEDKFRGADGKRQVNLDPGVLTLHHLVLATGKAYTHRPYLRAGIYADLTLMWQDGGWRTLPWTYPDYAGAPLQEVLTQIRETFRRRRRAGSEEEQG